MPELLLELFSEEIPARMQQKAADDLRSMVTNALVEAGLTYEGAQAHGGARRLVLSVEGLDAKAADVAEERKGPRVDAPQPAIDGFLKSTGLQLDQLKVQDDKKGQFYLAVIKKPGRNATEIIAGIVPDVIRKFPWPKSMRWGSGTLRWVRPLHSIVCTFDGEVVPFEIEGIRSGNVTRGHRFMGSQSIEVRRFEDYAQKLHDAKVIVDLHTRVETIRAEARNLAFAQGLELIEDEGLLKETAGLVEWPVVLMGSFDESFLAVPPEVITTSIKNHQKCFALRNTVTGKLANRYLMVSNLVAKDGGKTIIAGNNKVIAARLSDAKFFWDQDRNLENNFSRWIEKLHLITFHAKLGSQGERVKRIEALAGEIAKTIGADVEKAKLAARLAKADLVTGMVGEFPELQGLMGRYYALDQGYDPEVADAIRDHYKPVGPSDSIPVSRVGQAVALADKLDTLVGFWAIDEKPTGSKDPFALRRAALGSIRIVLDKNLRLQLAPIVLGVLSLRLVDGGLLLVQALTHESKYSVRDRVDRILERFPLLSVYLFNDGLEREWFDLLVGELASRDHATVQDLNYYFGDRLIQVVELLFEDGNPTRLPAVSVVAAKQRLRELERRLNNLRTLDQANLESGLLGYLRLIFAGKVLSGVPALIASADIGLVNHRIQNDLLAFFADRLKVYLKEQGARHDLIDAVFALGNQDDLLMIVKRVEALSKFLETDDGKNLLAGVKRASNILRIEEKKDGRTHDGDVQISQLIKGEEKALHSAITQAVGQTRKAIEHEDFEAAMTAIARLRGPVDAFFEHVTVNDKDATFRENRLKLLNRIRAATQEVADFSKIEG